MKLNRIGVSRYFHGRFKPVKSNYGPRIGIHCGNIEAGSPCFWVKFHANKLLGDRQRLFSLSEVLLEVLDTAATRAGILERIFQQSRRILIGGSEEKGGGEGDGRKSAVPHQKGRGAGPEQDKRAGRRGLVKPRYLIGRYHFHKIRNRRKDFLS